MSVGSLEKSTTGLPTPESVPAESSPVSPPRTMETHDRWRLRHVLPEAGHAAALFLVAAARLASDACYFFAVRYVVWLAEQFTSRYVVHGWSAIVTENIHQAGVVGAYLVFIALVLRDTIALWVGPSQHEGRR
jgi:hypothetical protein